MFALPVQIIFSILILDIEGELSAIIRSKVIEIRTDRNKDKCLKHCFLSLSTNPRKLRAMIRSKVMEIRTKRNLDKFAGFFFFLNCLELTAHF